MPDELKKGDSWYAIEVECPHCEKIQQVDSTDLDRITCESCNKEFKADEPQL